MIDIESKSNGQSALPYHHLIEIAAAYFKNGDKMKGSVFSKGAKAIRECEIPITTKKEALALKGVGKGIAGT